MNSFNLEIGEILDDRVSPSKLKIRFKEPCVETWLPAEEIPPPLILNYCHRIIQREVISRGDINHTVERLWHLLAASKEDELDSLLNEFLSVTGLELPSSKNTDIWIQLTNMVGKTCDIRELAVVRRCILIEKIIKMRKGQLVNLRVDELKINVIDDGQTPIKIRNDVDLEGLPPQLRYINQSILNSEPIPEVEIGCDCTGPCSSSCSHLKQEEEFLKHCIKKAIEDESKEPYDENGKINYSHKKPVFECNKSCQCNENCPRRVVQKGRKVALEIFRTFNRCGWGLRTLESIPKGTFVMKYTGELIYWEDGDKRENTQYLFDNDIEIDPNTGHPVFTIDAFKYGNVSRFMNHNCEPNLASHLVYINNVNPSMGDIAFFAARDIKPFEELSINYIGLVKSSNGKCQCSVCCSH